MHNQNLGRVAVVARGTYDPSAEYERLDAVSYNGSSYLVRKHCQGVVPAEGEYYMLMAKAGDSTAANAAAEKALAAADMANTASGSAEQQAAAAGAAAASANAAATAAQNVVDTVEQDINQLKGDLGQLSEEIEAVENDFARYNLFNKTEAEIVSIMCNSSLTFISGGGVQSTIWKCKPNTTYTLSWHLISGNTRFLVYTSSNEPVIDGSSKALRVIELSNTVSGSSRRFATITTNANENYLILYFWIYASGGESTLDSIQITKGDELLDYVPYDKFEMPNLQLVQEQFNGITIDVTNCTEAMYNLLGYRNLGALDKGYICLVADDGYSDIHNVSFPIVREKNVPITFALWTDSECITNTTLLAELREMIEDYGCGICQHGTSHFTDYSPQGLYDYLISEKTKWENLSLTVKGVAYPNHSRNAQVRTICGSIYDVCCCGGVTVPMVYNYYTLGAKSNIFDLYRISTYSTSEANLKSACDYAKNNNKLVIMFWHDSDIYGDTTQADKLKNVIDYAKGLGLQFINVGDIPSIA